MDKFIKDFLSESSKISSTLDEKIISLFIKEIANCKKNKGRIFFLGIGGSAGNASHAVNDFRKIAGIESYAPTDNISELTARTNDEGWEEIFSKWLITSRLNKKDIVFIFSVGGGNKKKKISINLIKAIDLAKKKGSKILSIVGKADGYAAKNSDLVIIVPVTNKKLLTPFSEAYQSILWHLLVSHPKLKETETMWESVSEKK
jgi:D-sedoheptulose 7-phosphate isomerase